MGQLEIILEGVTATWDGDNNSNKPVSDGTYYFFMKATAIDGTAFEQHGHILVTR